MPEPAVEQLLHEALFELAGLDRDPAWTGHFHTTNKLLRSLAHLIATDGRFSRLLKCTALGYLHTAGIAETVEPAGTGSALIAPASTTSVDFGTAKSRCVTVSGDNGPLRIYDSDTATGKTRDRIMLPSGAPYKVYTRGRYLDIENQHTAGVVIVVTWIDLE